MDTMCRGSPFLRYERPVAILYRLDEVIFSLPP